MLGNFPPRFRRIQVPRPAVAGTSEVFRAFRPLFSFHAEGVFIPVSFRHTRDSEPNSPFCRGGFVTQRLLFASVLAALWLVLSGHFSPFLITTLILSVFAVMALIIHLGLLGQAPRPLAALGPLLRYWAWLALEMAKANGAVIRAVLQPSRISPTMIWVRADQESELGRALFANSITLTPGTITVLVEYHHILVHALERDGATDLAGGRMGRRCARIDALLMGRTP